MSEFFTGQIRNLVYKLEARLERNRRGYLEKLPKNEKYFEGSMYDAIYETACKYPHNIALDYYKTKITYKSLIKKIDKVAAALKASGMKEGDKITICMPNTPEAVYMFYAVNEIGAVANMIHPLSSEKEIEDYVKRANSRMILCVDIAYPKVEAIIKNTNLEQVIVASAGRSMNLVMHFLYWLTKGRKNHVKKTQQVLTWDRFIARSIHFIGNPHTRMNKNDPAAILYSGGTTGKPKGVVLTNLNFNSQALGAKYFGSALLKPRYSMLCFLPNFHAFGLGMCTHMPLYYGMRLVLIPQFSAKKFRRYVVGYNINVIVGVPTALEYFIKTKFRSKELKRIRGVVSGGDILSQATKNELNKFLRDHGCNRPSVYTGYGLTEASGAILFAPAPISNSKNIVGFPLPDSEVMILDLETNKPAPVGAPGEILLRGFTIMQGYLNNPKETDATFIKIKGKKWLKTGDIGYMDERGAVYFKGRLKRMIITSGYNVYPTTVEDATLKCKLVQNCAVVGVPDELRGEKVKVFIVLKPDANARVAKKELAKIYKQYLAKYETPREMEFVESLPKTKLGKVDYNALTGSSDSPTPPKA